MWLSLLLLLLLIVIFLVQSMHGFYNALIMALLTVCCTVLAVGTYEYTALHWVTPYWKREYAQATALALSFGIPLLVLRLVTDQLIKRSNLLPSLVERVGSGVCGLLTALCMVGVIGLALQLLPFDKGVMGYIRVPIVTIDRENEPLSMERKPGEHDREVWMGLDRFAVGLTDMVSGGVFSGRQRLSNVHPDLLQEVGWVGGTSAEVARYVPPGSIAVSKPASGESTVDEVFIIKEAGKRVGEETEYEPVPPAAGNEYRVVQLDLKQGARDANKNHFFTLRQIRLIGEDRNGKRRQYIPVAIQEDVDADGNAPVINRHIRALRRVGKDWPITEMPFRPRSDHKESIEIVFEVPTGLKPLWIEYKLGGARAPLNFKAEEGAADDSTHARADRPAGSTSETVDSVGRRGNVRTATTRTGGSYFGDELWRGAWKLTSYREGNNVEIRRGVLKEGHIYGKWKDQANGRDSAVERLEVPSDKRLLHLDVKFLKAKSIYGKARQFATTTIQNYVVRDEQGRDYRICGKYARADVNQTDWVEVQYFPNQAGSIGGLGQFEHIDERKLDDNADYVLVYLFLVEPGARIVRFSTGGSADRADDLTEENLVAPD